MAVQHTCPLLTTPRFGRLVEWRFVWRLRREELLAAWRAYGDKRIDGLSSLAQVLMAFSLRPLYCDATSTQR
jgi:hypothetical protein